MLRQMAESESKVGSLSHQTHLPRGNDLTVQEQIAVIHGGATPAQCADTREMLLERQRQDIVDNTSPITPVSPAYSSVPETKDGDQTQSEEKGSLEWDDFPELDARYGTPPAARGSATLDPAMAGPPRYSTQASCISRVGTGVTSDTTLEGPSKLRNINFLNTNPPCTGPCPIQHPHNQGAYLRQGQVPRLWNARWGYSDPPRAIWEAWVRIEQGRGSSWDEVEVDGFALSHSWAGP